MTSTIVRDAIKIYFEKYPNLKMPYNGNYKFFFLAINYTNYYKQKLISIRIICINIFNRN